MEYNVINWENFSPKPMNFIPADRKGNMIGEDFMSLDTETSHNHNKEEPIGWIYHWGFKYGNDVVLGRKPSELIDCLRKIVKVNGLGFTSNGKSEVSKRIVCYIHNLSYDYEYLKEWLRAEFGRDHEKMLAVAKHKLITFEIGGFIFKCSFRLTQKSLDKWAKEVGAKSHKLVGNVDHNIIRYQDTPLTQKDIDYMIADVVVLDEALRIQMSMHGDTLTTIPYTATGYVRREGRKEFRKDKTNAKAFKNSALNLTTYKLCRKEFAGAITHGNRFLADEIQNGTIRHRDFASHYPSQQRCADCPISKFVLHYDSETDGEMGMKALIDICKNNCILAEIVFANMELRQGVTLPYAQECKFYQGRLGNNHFVGDNGRILSMSGGSVVVVNEHDLKWICKQYKFQYKILKVYTAKRGRFPQYLQNTVDKFFYGKTETKNQVKAMEKANVSEDSEEYKDMYRQMMFMKAWLNGIYGMSATDPIRISYSEGENGEWENEVLTDDDISAKLEQYYNSYNSFMSYQHGVWTTSNARNELMEFVELIGYENFIYADTDSIFYFSTPEIEEKVEKRNAELREIDDRNGMFVDVDGKRTYYNQFELENEEITQFKFLHSKCYAYILADGEMKVTIAGVKKYGRNGNTRVKELGSLNNLKDGYVFKDCGGTLISYGYHEPDTITIEGHETEYSSSAIIENVEKTLHGLFSKDEVDTFWTVSDELY